MRPNEQTGDLTGDSLYLRLMEKVDELCTIIKGKNGLENEVRTIAVEFEGVKRDLAQIKFGVFTVIVALAIAGICAVAAFMMQSA